MGYIDPTAPPPATRPKPQATVIVHLCIALDGREPLGDEPPSADDYRDEYRQFWNRFAAWMRAEKVTPSLWPDEIDWWHVSFASTYRIDEIERVLRWLHAQGVEVTNLYAKEGT